MVNVLVPHKNVKCRFSDYLLLESVWTGAVFHQPSVTADSPDLWLYTRAGLPHSPAPVRLRVPASREPQAGSCGQGQGPPTSPPTPRVGVQLPLPGKRDRMTAGPQAFFKIIFPPHKVTCVRTTCASSLAQKRRHGLSRIANEAISTQRSRGGNSSLAFSSEDEAHRGGGSSASPPALSPRGLQTAGGTYLPCPPSQRIARQPGCHWVPSNFDPDLLGKSQHALRRDSEDADTPYAVLLTYVSRCIKKSRFTEGKYSFTKHVSNTVRLFSFLKDKLFLIKMDFSKSKMPSC